MNTAEKEELARAILAEPRRHYSQKNAADMLALWDELASEYPEIVESTLYFSAPVRPECLAVRYIDLIENDGKMYLWVDLKTAAERRQCCYSWEGQTWVYYDGDKEPDMSESLARAWEKADEILTRVSNTQQTSFVSA